MSARPDTWMKMFWGDYARDTGHLNVAGHGAYLMLIKHYWCTGEALRDDDDELWRIACCDSKKDWLKLRPKIVRFFTSDGHVLRHKRIDKELRDAVAITTSKAEAGRKGAESRWQKNSSAMAEPSASHRQTDATSESESESESERKVAKVLPLDSLPARVTGWGSQANGAGPPRWEDEAIVPAGLDPKKPADHPDNVRDRDRPTVNGFFLDSTFEKAMDAARINPAKSKATRRPVIEWLKAGIEPSHIYRAIERCTERDGYIPPQTLAYFDRPVREFRADRAA